MTGRKNPAMRLSGGANSLAAPSVRCRASRFGASSPTTRVTNVINKVTPTTPVAAANPSLQPWSTRKVLASSDRVTAPNALDSRAVVVTPICTAARNRFGSLTSRATIAPRRPDSARARTWPSRNETSAISVATNRPSMTISSKTMPMLISVAPVTLARLGAVVALPGNEQRASGCHGASVGSAAVALRRSQPAGCPSGRRARTGGRRERCPVAGSGRPASCRPRAAGGPRPGPHGPGTPCTPRSTTGTGRPSGTRSADCPCPGRSTRITSRCASRVAVLGDPPQPLPCGATRAPSAGSRRSRRGTPRSSATACRRR